MSIWSEMNFVECIICQLRFADKKALENHRSRQHRDVLEEMKKEGKIHCHCGKGFSRRDNLKRHQEKYHVALIYDSKG